MGPNTVNRTVPQSQLYPRLRPSAHRRISVAVRAASQKVAPAGTQRIGGGGTRTFKAGDGGSQSTKETGGTNFFSALGTQFKRAGSSPRGRVDPNTIFLAGATGRLGARILRELLSCGFKVRAGVRDVAAAKKTVDTAVQYGLLDGSATSALQLVEYDLEEPDSISAALGNAGRVVCAVGIAEASLDPSGPKRIDGDGTTALINAAAAAGVQQFVLVSSLGTGKVGFPASVLNLFFGILTYKRESEKALEASGMTYTIVRPGGLERPTDAYKETHNVVLSTRDTTFGGQVSRLQVAELVGAALRSPNLAENKVLEVTAETTAPRRSYEELLAKVPSDFSKEEQQAKAAEVEAAKAALNAAQQKADAARQALGRVDDRVAELSERAKQAKSMETGVKGQTSSVFKGSQSVQRQLAEAKAAVDKAVAQEAAAKAVLEASRKAAASGQLLSDKEKKEAREQALNPAKAKPAAAAPAPAPVFNLFGAKPAAAAVPSKEEVKEEVVEKPAAAVADAFNFFGTRIMKAGTQVKAAVEPKVEQAVAKAKAAEPKVEQAAAKVDSAAAKAGTQVKAAVAQAAAPAKAPEPPKPTPPPPPPPAPTPAPAAKKAAPPPPPPAAVKKEPEAPQELSWLDKRQQEAAAAKAAKEAEDRAEAERLKAAVAAWEQGEAERKAKEEAAAKAKEDARLKALADEKAAADKAKADALAAAEKAKAEKAAAADKAKAEKAAASEKAKADAAAAKAAKAAPPAAAPSAESNGASAPPAVPTQEDQKKQVQAWIADYRARSGKTPVKANQ